jgi:uncharacterized protein (TIGR02453 family)
MDHISKDTLAFLKELKANNERDWFEANKMRYKLAHDGLIAFVDGLLPTLSKLDKTIQSVEAKKTVFRIYRDVRFSPDKSPYKTNMGAHVHAGGKNESRAGFYIHIEPGNCFLAGGAYAPPGPWMKAIRKEIHHNAAPLKKILASASFKKYFGEMEGESLKTSPRDYDVDHPEIELLRRKSFLAVHKVKDSQLTKNDYAKHCKEVFKALAPFDAYLNMAMD